MPFAVKLLSTLILVTALVSCSSTNGNTGKPCERCSHGYAPASDKHAEQRAVCVVNGKVVNCDKIPAECNECARIQKHDLDRADPTTH